jgi:hypothetical protein
MLVVNAWEGVSDSFVLLVLITKTVLEFSS